MSEDDPREAIASLESRFSQEGDRLELLIGDPMAGYGFRTVLIAPTVELGRQFPVGALALFGMLQENLLFWLERFSKYNKIPQLDAWFSQPCGMKRSLKNGASALGLQSLLGLAKPTAWSG